MKPLYDFFALVLQALHGVTHSYGWAIVIFSLGVKLLLYYPTQQQYKSMREMQLIQPELKRLQEKHKGDSERLNKETMELMKKHNVNPLGGCLPMLVQMPILYGIYGAIRQIFPTVKGVAPTVTVPHETFLWIGTPFAQAHAPWLGAGLQAPDTLMVLLYGFSMMLSQRMTTTTTSDPAQMQQQKLMNTIMPVMFTFMMWKWALPSALVFYWFMFNMFNVVQQVHINRDAPRSLSPPRQPPEPPPGRQEDPTRGPDPELVKAS